MSCGIDLVDHEGANISVYLFPRSSVAAVNIAGLLINKKQTNAPRFLLASPGVDLIVFKYDDVFKPDILLISVHDTPPAVRLDLVS
jgi:hypothetical protein